MLKKQPIYILLIFSCITLFSQNLNAAVFQNTTGRSLSYIFVPGMISIETQTAKYIPEFIGTSGETIACNGGIHTLNQPITTCSFSETSPQSLSNQSMNPFVYLGYWFTSMQNKRYGVSVKRVQEQPTEQDLVNRQVAPSAYTVEKHAFDWTKLNFGQEADINALLKTYTDHCEKHPDSDVGLYGVSRGAGVICTLMGKHNLPNVKFLILEAPFDSIPHLLKHTCRPFHSGLNKILPKLTSYDPNGDSPLLSVANISKDIPKLLVGSSSDKVVPLPCVKALMRKFVKEGHKNVHLLVLSKSGHSGYAFDDYADKTKYESVVHAFYKHYGLPHDEALALQGADEWKKISGQSAMMPSN